MRQQKTFTPDKPFLIYFAPGATHAPHHVPKEYINRYKGKFDKGWDVVREETLANMKAKGIVPPDTELTGRPEGVEAWDELNETQKKVYARLMETYAGFAEHTDAQVMRLMDALDAEVGQGSWVLALSADHGVLDLPEARMEAGLPAARLGAAELAAADAALAGDFAQARKLHLELFPVCKGMFIETNPIPIKCAMKLLGRDTGEMRLPMTPLGEDGLGKLRKALEVYGAL